MQQTLNKCQLFCSDIFYMKMKMSKRAWAEQMYSKQIGKTQSSFNRNENWFYLKLTKHVEKWPHLQRNLSLFVEHLSKISCFLEQDLASSTNYLFWYWIFWHSIYVYWTSKAIWFQFYQHLDDTLTEDRTWMYFDTAI